MKYTLPYNNSCVTIPYHYKVFVCKTILSPQAHYELTVGRDLLTPHHHLNFL